MCGICGTIGLDPKLDGEAVVRRMLAAIVHRGPDEEAFLDATPVVLGLGHSFRTNSDTEVIVHAYEQWGQACPAKLRGMFAFAIVEMPQGRNGRSAAVFLARDPLGIKPLYYTKSAN